MNKQKKLRRGDPIPGSRFVRAYCDRCDAPMRVSSKQLMTVTPIYCECCDPPVIIPSAATKDDLSPWQENAIRAMEEG